MYFSDFHHASKKLQLKLSEMYFVLLQYGAKVLQLIDFDKVHESVGAFRRKWMTFRLEKKKDLKAPLILLISYFASFRSVLFQNSNKSSKSLWTVRTTLYC